MSTGWLHTSRAPSRKFRRLSGLRGSAPRQPLGGGASRALTWDLGCGWRRRCSRPRCRAPLVGPQPRSGDARAAPGPHEPVHVPVGWKSASRAGALSLKRALPTDAMPAIPDHAMDVLVRITSMHDIVPRPSAGALLAGDLLYVLARADLVRILVARADRCCGCGLRGLFYRALGAGVVQKYCRTDRLQWGPQGQGPLHVQFCVRLQLVGRSMLSGPIWTTLLDL